VRAGWDIRQGTKNAKKTKDHRAGPSLQYSTHADANQERRARGCTPMDTEMSVDAVEGLEIWKASPLSDTNSDSATRLKCPDETSWDQRANDPFRLTGPSYLSWA
jgi:hypothetical protein